MTSQFSPKVSEILAFSREEATRLASSSVGPEHLLLGILREKNSPVLDLFKQLSINTQTVKEELEEKVREDELSEPIQTNELVLNTQASNILKLAVLEARIQHTQMVDVQHLLLAILHDQVDNGAKEVLEMNNLDYETALKMLRKPATKDGIGLPDEEEEDYEEDGPTGSAKQSGNRQQATATQPQGNGKTPVLDNFSTDLTRAAAEGKLDPVVGREKEIQRVIEILGRRKKNNPILIGEPGVGKSAIVEGLAQLIAGHKTSPMLFNRRVVSLDMTAIVAGTKYRGQFEERIRALLKELENNPNIIVFIDEIHKAIDALDEVGSRVHLQNAKMPPEITLKEKDIEDIKQKKQEAVGAQNFELAANYRDQQLQLEDELKQLQQQWQKGDAETRQTVTDAEVADVVSMMTGVPVQRMAEAEGIRLRNMANDLKKAVIGQDPAIEKMVKAIQRNRVGLKDPNHPIGAFMFLGPTGVGKTYLAKKLAETLFGSPEALIRIDMSEYTESFNVSRLIGAPPGYVGYEEGGQLTERVRRHPYSIVLLDEIEKAHGNVFNLLLQVLDEGRLTDGNGRLVDFRNTVIIMTSNAGTRQLKEFGHGVGFTASGIANAANMDNRDKQYARSIIQKSLSRQFSPEFLNRLDEIIMFDQLDLSSIKKIIDIELQGLYKRIEDMGYHVELTDKAKELVATKGYDVQFGARPLKRAIQTYIEDGLSEKILSEELKPGDTIQISKNPKAEELIFKVKQQVAKDQLAEA
jgi:ATP-dependent Clp protease ATP-binding subunit ClpA